MKIAISGATGFVGTRLSAYLSGLGHRIVPLSRELFRTAETLGSVLEGCTAVINLAGAPINRRWSRKYKNELYDSRVNTTRLLVEAVNGMKVRPTLFISVSAVGYYSDQGCSDESADKGTGALADLCEAWEAEARRLISDVRLVITRFGVVLAPSGGAFEQMIRPFRYGVATRIASGKQSFSWIDREDLIRAMEFIVEDDSLSGVVNLTAPEQLTHGEFTRLAGRYYGDWFYVAIPAWVFRLLYGEGAGVVTLGQCVRPRKLLDGGFRFISPTLTDFFAHLSTPNLPQS